MDVLIQFILDHGVTWGVILSLIVLVVFLLRLVFDVERSDIFRARIYQALAVLTKRRSYEKKFISSDIRGRLNLARRDLHFGESILPSAVSVEWIEIEDPASYDIREGQFIVRLDPGRNQNHNTVVMADAIVRRTTLQGIRHLTNGELARAIELTLVKKLLRRMGRPGVLDLFYSQFYRPMRSGDPKLDEWVASIAEIDDQGLFERLLLVELEDFSRRIVHLEPRPYMIGELEQLVHWVHGHAIRRVGQRVPLRYTRAHIRVGVVLVAKSATIMDKGIEPYLESVRISIEEEHLDVLYLVIWEKPYLASGGLRREYARKCRALRREMQVRYGVREHFCASYGYVDPNGLRREGEITRFLVSR